MAEAVATPIAAAPPEAEAPAANAEAPAEADEDTGDAAGQSEEQAEEATGDTEEGADEAAQKAADAKEAEKKAVEALCTLMMGAADQYAVPADFFIRLIWKESRFNAGAVSPVGAQGIAQFMPGTARLRGLKDPFDREQALYASASFLADMKADFGSWGLAAIGYNGGPNRVMPLVRGTGGLPYETIDYVFSITGRSHQYWASRA
ncbi:MAG: lytic transglycosylase domain-containing protein, partial [Pseudomonadota bacterium]